MVRERQHALTTLPTLCCQAREETFNEVISEVEFVNYM